MHSVYDAVDMTSVEAVGSHVYAEGDGTTVWVHDGAESIARFGKMGYEIYGSGNPRSLVDRGPSAGVSDWLAFKAKVLEVHGFDIEQDVTPRRFFGDLGIVPGTEAGPSLYRIKVARLAEYADPFQEDIWGRDPVTMEAVRHCIETGNLASSFVEMGIRPRQTHNWDARRVAYFVVHPDEWPISIEFTSPDGAFEFKDGWHRFAAAIYRQADEIAATLGGFVDGWDVVFPDRVPLHAADETGYVPSRDIDPPMPPQP